VTLRDQYAVRLWLGSDQQNYESRPVVELLDHGVTVQWWISPRGDGWNGSLTCIAGRSEPNCVLLDSLGMHAGVAEILLLQGGRLVVTGCAPETRGSGPPVQLLHGACPT
jgi:hypothetical protein